MAHQTLIDSSDPTQDHRFADSPSRRFGQGFSPLDIVVFAYLALLSLILLGLAQLSDAAPFLGYHALVALMIVLLVRADRGFGGRFWNVLRWGYPIVLVPAAFREVWFTARLVNPFDGFRNPSDNFQFDRMLNALDLRLFGIDSGRLVALAGHPLLTDLLTLCYAVYYFLPVILVLHLYIHGKMAQFEVAMTAIVAAFLVSYLGYLVVPAVGPFYFLRADEVHPALLGWVVAMPVRDLLKGMEWTMPDAFPSGHTMVTLVTLHYAWRFARPLSWILMPVGAGLVVATVYLRYHYLVDVTAGMLLTAGILAAMVPVQRKVFGQTD